MHEKVLVASVKDLRGKKTENQRLYRTVAVRFKPERSIVPELKCDVDVTLRGFILIRHTHSSQHTKDRIKRDEDRYATIRFFLSGIYFHPLHSTTRIFHYTYSYTNYTQTVIMFRSCVVCKAVASPDLQLQQYCAQCQSALYCSKACQRIDWKMQHKKICKLLNVGHGGMQVRSNHHEERRIDLKDEFDVAESSCDESDERFFKFFQESTFEGSRAVAQKMKKYAKRQTRQNQKKLLYYSLYLLIHSDSEMLSWPSSPLLVMLQFIDPNVLFGQEGRTKFTSLHVVAELADPFEYSTHENQLILARQLIEHGANINAVSVPQGETALFGACFSENVTNLDFVELLLKKGADPNTQDSVGRTALMSTAPHAPGAAKFLLNWPTTEANITTPSKASFLTLVRKAAHPDNPEEVQDQLLLQQWTEIEEIMVEWGAHDTGIE
jgi:hypothetical protein